MKDDLRKHLLKTCSHDELTRWFDPLAIDHDGDAKELVVAFPHTFFGQWFADQVQGRFEDQLGEFLGNGWRVKYHTGNGSAPGAGPATAQVTSRIDFPFDRQFTFETFLVNKKNYFPLASAKEVAKQEAMFNPFVICGKNGSGKSHILRAIANEMSKRRDAGRILFTNAGALRGLYDQGFGKDAFKTRARVGEYEALFVDDLHQLADDEDMQLELVTIFNHFHESRKQMIFGCQDKLSSYESLHPTLKSRLEWGLIVTLKRPDLDIRVAYIKDMARRRKLALSKEQVLTLAQRFQDFRYLQGILLKLFAFRELVKQDLSDKDFEHILSNTEEKATEALSTDAVKAIVSDRMGVTIKEMVGSKRQQHIAMARQVAMYLCRTMLGVSYPALGREFGGKDHSTVLYSVRKIERLQKDNESLKQLLKELKQRCRHYDHG